MTATAPQFTFDPANHSYMLGPNRLPSVTELLTKVVIDGIGLVDVRFCDERGRMRGKLVHQGAHFDLDGDLNEDDLDKIGQGWYDKSVHAKIDLFQPGEFAGYIRGLRKCRDELELEPFKEGEFETKCGVTGPGLELPLWHPQHLYAGTADFIGTGKVVSLRRRGKVLVDWKLGAAELGYPLQTAAYVNLLKDSAQFSRLKIRLFNDGTYKVVTHELRDLMRDTNLGLSALALLRYKRAQNGIR